MDCRLPSRHERAIMIHEKVKEIEEANVRLVANVIGLQAQLLDETGHLNRTIEDLKQTNHKLGQKIESLEARLRL